MTYCILGPTALDYFPCQYDTSKLIFRGPRRDLGAPYVAFIGGTQTYGKFIEQPYPLKVEHLTGVPSVNLGLVNAGVDVFAKDTFVVQAAHKARVAVIEVLGAANLSNRLYTVHTRRNDRFLRASPELQKLYPETDFSQFNFTQHMLLHLYRRDEARFAMIRSSLQRVWSRRMRQLVGRIGTEVVLVRIAAKGGDPENPADMLGGPLLVTDGMLDSLGDVVSAIVDVPFDRNDCETIPEGMVVGPIEVDAAKTVAPPQTHATVAQALRPVLDRLM